MSIRTRQDITSQRTFINKRTRGYLFLKNSSSGGDDIDYLATGGELLSATSVGGITASNFGSIKGFVFQSGVDNAIMEWTPRIAVECAFDSVPHTASEVDYGRTGRTSAATYSDVKLLDYSTDLMFEDFDDNKFVQKIGRCSTRISDVDCRFTTSGVGATGAETENWPLYYSRIKATSMEVYQDGLGFDNYASGSAHWAKVFPSRIVTRYPYESIIGDAPNWHVETVMDCGTLWNLIDGDSILYAVLQEMIAIAAAVNNHAALLDSAVQAGAGLGGGTATNYNYATTTDGVVAYVPCEEQVAATGSLVASPRFPGTDDVPYY